MKKRLLSALLALAMFFSIVPSGLASQTWNGTEFTGDNFISSLVYETDADGKVSKFEVKTGSDWKQGSLNAVILINGEWGDGDFPDDKYDNALTDPYTALNTFTGYTDKSCLPALWAKINGADAGQTYDLAAVASHVYEFLTVQGVQDSYNDQIGGDTGWQIDGADIGKGTDVSVTIYVGGSSLQSGPASGFSADTVFTYTTNLKVGEANTISIGGTSTPAPTAGPTSEPTSEPTATAISSVNVSLSKPTVGGTPTTSASSTTTGIASVDTVTWNGSPSTFAINTGYKAEFDIHADTGYEFAETITGSLVDTTLPSSGYVPTVAITRDATDKTLAHVTVTYPAITVKSAVFAPANSTKNVATGATDTLDTSTISAIVTYNNGDSPATFPYASFPSWITLVGNGNTLSGTSVSNITNGSTISVKIGSSVTQSGSDLSGIILTYGIADTPVTNATVNFAFPEIGSVIATTASSADSTKYTVDGNAVVWTVGGLDATGNFEYGKAYKAEVVLTSASGYSLDTSTNVTFADTGSSDTQIASFDGTTAEYTFPAVTAPTAAKDKDYDYYNGGNAVTISLAGSVITDITKVEIGSQNVTSNVTIDNNAHTVTIPASVLKTIAEATGTSIIGNATGATWTAKLTIEGSSSTIDADFTAKDTTPYITITDGTNATISSTPSLTKGSKVALEKNTQYVLSVTKPAHATNITWTVTDTNGSTITDTDSDDYKFTFTTSQTGGEDITATATVTVDTGSTLTVNATNGSVAVQKDGVDYPDNGTAGQYTIYSDETYTLTATADNQYKFTGWSGALSGTTNPETIANPTGNKTVTANFTAKTAPTISADMVYRKGANDTDKAFTITLGDYSGVSVSGTPAGTLSGTTYTVSASALESASVGDHTYTFDFGEDKTLTGKIEVKAAMSVSNLTLPTTLKHGDTIDTISFKVTDDGTTTTYTYSGGSWNNTPGSEIKFQVGTGSLMGVSDFVSTYLDKAVYVDKGTRSDVLQNGDIITVSAGSSTNAATLSVAKKDIVLDASTTDTNGFNKTYDGNATVTASPINWALATGNAWVSGDTVPAASDITIAGTYQKTGQFGTDDANAENLKQIKFTATAANGTDAAKNYNITVNNGSGKISPKSLTIKSVTNLPSAKNGIAKSGTINSTAITDSNLDAGTPLASADSSINIKYDYAYAASNSTDVSINNISSLNTNYTITNTTLTQTGTREPRNVTTIDVVPDTTTYNYSDTLSNVKITIHYGDSDGDSVFNSISAAKTAGVSVYWGSDTSKTVTDGQSLNVNDHKTITAAFGGKTGSANITVNPLHLTATAEIVQGKTITKTYDGGTTSTQQGDVTLTPALVDSAYNGVSLPTLTVQSGGLTYDYANTYEASSVSVAVNNVTLSDSDNFVLDSVTNTLPATITKATVTVTVVPVPNIKQGTANFEADKTVLTSDSGVTATGMQKGEAVKIKYHYKYDNPNVANDTSVTITGLDLVSGEEYAINKNYTVTGNPTATGLVDERTVDQITVTDPSQFGTAQTYGGKLALAGLEVQISFTSGGSPDGSETYAWNSDGTWTKKVQGEQDENVSLVPFKLSWQGTSDTPANEETLTVARSGKGITATSTVNTAKSGTSSSITVNPLEVKNITITGDNVTKKYDSTKDVKGASFTYALTDILVGTDALSVAPTKVEYPDAAVGTGKTLNYTGWTLSAGNGSTNASNYDIVDANVVIAANAPTGDIELRPITLTKINNVTAINQYDTKQILSGSATSDGDAVFATYDANAQTGIISGETVTVNYTYEYNDPDTSTGANAAAVTLKTATLSSADAAKYTLTWNTATATGTVNETAISGIDITGLPTQFQASADVQYGDKLDLSGLEVTVTYGDPTTKTEVYATADGTNWTKDSTAINTSDLPFTLTLGGAAPTQGSDLLTVDTAGKQLTVTTGNSKNDTDGTLKVGQRKVTVTPKLKSGVTKLTKVYNSDTDYTNNGDVEFDVASVSSYTGTLPTVTGATYAYDDETVSGATKVTVSAPELSDTTNFVVNNYSNTDLDAEITARPIVVTAISIPDVNKYADVSQKITGATATSSSGATFTGNADPESGVVSGDTVGITYDYKYADSTSTPTTSVTIENIAPDSSVGESTNYSLTPTKLTGSATVNERTVSSIDVTNPTQLQSAVTYKTQLDVSGLKVKINFTDSSSDEYTAAVIMGNVTWTKTGASTIAEANLPFTLAWDNTSASTFSNGQDLTVTDHNTHKIVATYKGGGTGSGAVVTVKPIEISAITATLTGTIEKEYDGNTNVTNLDGTTNKIEYSSSQVQSGDTVTLSATPHYTSKDVVTNPNNITFDNISVTGNANYALKTTDGGATVSGASGNITGTITQKAVTITGVYIPTTYKNGSATDNEDHSYTNARVAANTTAENSVTIDATNCFVSGEESDMTFAYTVTYKAADLATAGSPTVTLSGTNVTGTALNPASNYNITWSPSLTGSVIDDRITYIQIDASTAKLTGYTHGDKLNLAGLKVTVTTDNTGTKTYTVTGTEDNYAWDTAIPDYISIGVNGISLKDNTALNGKAHYTKMNGNPITVSATGVTPQLTGNMGVAQKQLTATASTTDTLEKVYNANAKLPTGTTIAYTITAGEVANFGTDDDVAVTASAAYADANVNTTAGENHKKSIVFTNINLTGADAGNYIVPSAITALEGKIKPFEIKVTDIAEAIPDAKLNDNNTKTGTIASTTSYTNNVTPDGTLPIKFTYSYDNVNSTGSHTVTIDNSSVALVTPNTNYTVTATVPTKTGTVKPKDIQSIEITTQPTKDSSKYKYGDTLTLAGMKVKVTYTDGSTESDIEYDPTNANSVWSMLGLAIDGTADGTVLKTANNGNKIYVKKGNVKSTNSVNLTVNKRTLLLERADTTNVTKKYDGTQALGSGQTIELKIADSQTGYDGLYGSDSFTVNTPTYIYLDENASDTEYTLTPSTAVTISGNNSGEYTLVVPDVKGKITKQSVTLTPVIADIPVDKFATTDKTITETSISIGTKLTQSGIVSGEESNFTFGYTVTVSTTQLGTANTYTITPTATSESGTGTGNYDFQWQNATVKVVANDPASATITKDPTKALDSYVYGDSLDLTGMEVTVTYADNSTHKFTYGSQEWTDEGLEVQWSDNTAVSTTQILKTSDNKGIQVKVADGVIAGPTSGISVGQRTLNLTATATDSTNGIKKTYDTYDTVAASQVSVDSTGKYSTDVVTIGTVTAKYDTKNQGTNKTVTVSVSGTSIKDAEGNDVTNQYNIVQPTNLTGTIEPKAITVTGINVPNILTGVSGNDLKVTATTDYSEQPESGVSVTITATYPDSTQDAGQTETTKTVTFAMTETGNDAGNYAFTLNPNTGTGKVVNNVIKKIIVTPPNDTEYTHGENLNLTGMAIAVEYVNAVDNNTYTYVSDDNWTDKDSNTVTTGSLPVSFVLVKDGTESPVTTTQQLRRDKNDGSKLVVKGDGVTNEDNDGASIGITVKPKVIDTITVGYANKDDTTQYTAADITKTYNGKTDVDDQAKLTFTPNNIVTFGTTPDVVKITAAAGAATYDDKDVNSVADSKEINFDKAKFSVDNTNYVLKTVSDTDSTPDFTVSGTIKGNITKATITIKITSVPPIVIGGEKVQTLTKVTNYSQSGEQNNETVDVTVKGTYDQNETATSDGGSKKVTYAWSIADTTNNNNYTVSLKNADGNVIDNTSVFGPEGTVNKKPITGIAVDTTNMKKSYEHGDPLKLDGMKITVTYNNDPNDQNVYEKCEDGKWMINNVGPTTTPPSDIKITWDTTDEPEPEATNNETLRLDDTDKGYATDGDNKKATIKVAPSATGSLVEPATTDITIAQKQLTLKLSGAITKVYDGNNQVGDKVVLNSTTATTGKAIASLDGVDGGDSGNVEIDTAAITYDGKDVTTGTPALVVGTITITGDKAGYYKAPNVNTANSIDNQATGTITARPIKIIAITKDMDNVVGATAEGDLTGLTSSSYTLKTDDPDNYLTIVSGEDIKINVHYVYGDTTTEHDTNNKTTVTYSNPTVPTTDNAYASNYNVTFDIAQGSAVISSGTVTNVALSGQFQTGGYTHGDKFSLDNMVITITYNNGNSDAYAYVDTTDKWKLTRTINSVAQTPQTGVSLPNTLSLKLGSTTINTNPTSADDKTIVKYDNNTNTLVATYTKDENTVNSTPSAAYGVGQKTITINITPPTSGPEIEQEYQGQSDKSLNAANLAKLSVYIPNPSEYAVPNEDVSVTKGTLTAEFASYDVARDDNGDVKAQGITVPDSVFELGGNAKGNYKIAVNNTATGKVTPKAATITANSVPAINEGATNLVVDITDDYYTTDGFLTGDTPTITWKGTYNTSDPDATSISVDLTTTRTVDDATKNNYTVTFTPDSMNGTVTPSDVTDIAIKAPDNLAGYEHGDSIDLTGTEITVTYGSRTDKYVYDKTSKKWTYTKGGTTQDTKVDLPSEITLSFTGGSAITPDSAVKLSDNNKTITATYKKDADSDAITGSTTDTIEVKPKTLKITVSVKDGATIEQTYANDKVLSSDNFDKLNVDTTGVVAVGDEQITLTPAAGGVKAEFANATVARDENGNAIAQNISLAEGAYTLGGNDADNYNLVIESDATGTVKPATVTVTANSVPPINEGATDLVVDITDFTADGILDADKANITIEWQGTYDMTTAVVDTTTKRNVTGSAKDNYKFEFTPDTFNGEVKAKTVTRVTIDNQPAFADETHEHGDKIGEGGLDNLEYTVEYSDGSKTHHKIENGEWVEDDTYTKPEEGTAIKWNGSTEDATEDSVIRRDKDNTITITVEGKSDTTDVVAADVKPITIKATGLYKKVYDGTNAVTLNETAPEITYVIEGLADGDAVTVKATPAFADENVAKFGDVYQKAISFTNVELVGDEDILANYTIAVDDDGKAVADIMGQITPKPINITSITVASKTKGSSVDVTAKKNKAYTTNDIIEKDKGTVTISYTGKYSSTSATGTNVPVTIDTIEIDGDEKAVMNYVIGTVDGAAGNVTTGGGGGAVNTLTIKYKLEDGTAGDAVSKIETSVGSDSVDLIGVFKTKPANTKVLWTSSDEKVAKVDENGIVSFIGEGKATITATSESNKSLKDTVEVTVTASTATPEPTTTPTPTHKPTGTTEPTPIPGKVNESIITKNMLNPYIVGYDDNVFGPELPISREEVSAIFARLIANNIYMDKDYDTSFPDVPEGWSKSYIGYLEGFNVVTGYEDGTFHPQDYITRAEMAVMMAKAEGYDISGYMSSDEIEFPDVDEGYSTWAIKAIKYLTDAGIMEGYTDGTFRPNRPITRAETVATVNRVLANMVVDKIEVLPSDVTSEHWAYNDIVFAMNHRILKDVAADPNAFIWSEQFDENMQTITEVVEGEGTVDKTEPEPETEPTPEPDATTAE